MKVLEVRNAHEGLPKGLRLLDYIGIERDSRNGPVLVAPCPVTTVFEQPCERVVFWPARDGNPFFHLYESLWMLAGRNDVAPLVRYVKNAVDYSDDGKILHGAYGHRWRNWFADWSKSDGQGPNAKLDQLELIAIELKENPESRRCVLQMWDGQYDLGRSGKDLPCNTIATFQRGFDGKLNLVVFCRSNDIVWGLFGANCVQFSMLLEYMALWIGCPVGTYSQVSVNFHAYDNEVWKQVELIRPDKANFVDNPYIDGRVHHVPMSGSIEYMDQQIKGLLNIADGGDSDVWAADPLWKVGDWSHMVYLVLVAHHIYKTKPKPEGYIDALKLLSVGDEKADWIVASREWLQRRYDLWKVKKGLLDGGLSHP